MLWLDEMLLQLLNQWMKSFHVAIQFIEAVIFFFHILPLSGAEDLTPAYQINYDNKVDWKKANDIRVFWRQGNQLVLTRGW